MRRTSTSLWAAAAIALLVAGVWLVVDNIGSAPPADGNTASTASEPGGVTIGPSGLVIPVVGVRPADLIKSFDTASAGAEPVHDAIDIFAPAGTGVVAAAPGTVEELSFDAAGDGISAQIRSEDGYSLYYYAHLQSYAPGLEEGQRVRRGHLIGRVGSTGNASQRAPHLHFAIKRVQPRETWSQGSSVRPLPALIGKTNG